MKLIHPYLLNLLWALIPFAGILIYGILERRKVLSRFADFVMFPVIIPDAAPARRWIKAVLTLLASACFIVALCGPEWGYKWEKINEKGVDIMIALDCSKSMLAQDIKPDRLERAKREVMDLLHMMKSDRAGLVAFSGKAVLQCPLTLDHEAFHIFLNVLTPGFLPVGGTNVSEALMTAYNGFEKESDTQKAVILITDGENTAGDAEGAAKMMAKEGIKIFCIGVGGMEGAPIPDEKGGFKKDDSGNIVLTRVDESALEKLAALTGGAYARSVAGDMDLDLIYTQKIRGGMEGRTFASGRQKVWENRFQWFVFPGLILLLMESLLLPGKMRRKNMVALWIMGALMLAMPVDAHAGLFSSPVAEGIKAYAQKQYEAAKKYFIDAQLANPDDKRHDYNIGTAAYMNKEYEEALKHFSTASEAKDKALRHKARFNHANTQYRLGKLDEAINEYEDLIKEFPDDREAKENLEFVKQKKQEEDKKPQDTKDQETPKDPENKKNDRENSSDQGNNAPENKNPDNQRKEDNPPEEQNRPPKPQDNAQRQSPGQESKDPAKPAEGNTRPTKGDLDNILNRLEDKPGSALIPHLQENNVEKDW